ncbi:MAG TPA: polysaccharide export protein [Thermopetrobacter sp.]|nr:polysaccharide export protein [Thermopetrobacter sp.]
MRATVVMLVAAMALAGCARDWESDPPAAAAGGTGVTATGTIASGPAATAPASVQPANNEAGVVPPFGATGEAAAYEYLNGYRVGAGDRLRIVVMGQRELTGTYIVDPDGNISMPLINTVRVAGLTAREIENLVTRRLGQGFLRNPAVSVQPVSLRPFYILGEVQQAGSYPYQPGMTVQNAIALARGYTPRADKGEVMLTRRTSSGTRTYKVPVTTQLYPGDIIFVRERWL